MKNQKLIDSRKRGKVVRRLQAYMNQTADYYTKEIIRDLIRSIQTRTAKIVKAWTKGEWDRSKWARSILIRRDGIMIDGKVYGDRYHQFRQTSDELYAGLPVNLEILICGGCWD